MIPVRKAIPTIEKTLGSTVAVTDGGGSLVQTTGYYPSGTPYKLPSEAGTDVDAVTEKLHIGNKWIGHKGFDLYDNTARMHDPLLARFHSVDPLFGNYPGSSPWTHCLANPLSYVDPDGRYFIFNNITEDDKARIKEMLERGSNNNIIISFDSNRLVVEAHKEINKDDILSDFLVRSSNEQKPTVLNIKNSSYVIIGDVETATLDLDDMSNLGQAPPMNDVGALIHEMYEQYQVQNNKKDYNKAHERAIGFEGAVMGVEISVKRPISYKIQFFYNEKRGNRTSFPKSITVKVDSKHNIKKRK